MNKAILFFLFLVSYQEAHSSFFELLPEQSLIKQSCKKADRLDSHFLRCMVVKRAFYATQAAEDTQKSLKKVLSEEIFDQFHKGIDKGIYTVRAFEKNKLENFLGNLSLQEGLSDLACAKELVLLEGTYYAWRIARYATK